MYQTDCIKSFKTLGHTVEPQLCRYVESYKPLPKGDLGLCGGSPCYAGLSNRE